MATVTVVERRRSAELRLRLESLLKGTFGGDVAKLGAAAVKVVEGSEHAQFGKQGAQTPPEEIAAESLRMFLEGRDWLEKNLERWEAITDKLATDGKNGGQPAPASDSALRGLVASALASMESRAHGEDPALTALAAFAKRAEQQVPGANEAESVVALRRFLDGAEPDERFRAAWEELARVADAISTQVASLVIGRTAKHLDTERRLRGPSEALRARLRARLEERGALEFSRDSRSPASRAKREFVESVVGWWSEHEEGEPPQNSERAMSWLARFVQGDKLVEEPLLAAWNRVLDGLEGGQAPERDEPDERPEIKVDLGPEAPLREELELAREIEAELAQERDAARAEVAELKQKNERQAAALKTVGERAEKAEQRVGEQMQELERTARALAELSADARQSEATVAELRATADRLGAQAAETTASASEVRERLAVLEASRDAEVRRLESELVAAASERERLESELAERADAIRELEAAGVLIRDLEAQTEVARSGLVASASLVGEFREEYGAALLRLLDRAESDPSRAVLLERLDKMSGLT